MKLYQPVLFVGLGGTGCRIGAELERRMREELCGPDGTQFMRRRGQADMLPYQLPSCAQFVYADVNQADLDRLPRRVVPGAQHEPAVHLNAHYVRDLVPRIETYPEVALSLRLSAGEVVENWLPPKEGEPRVAPLQRGAGQLPTVGRAALFETFRDGVTPAVRDLRRAVGNLARSGEDLYALGGQPPEAVDVFVAFSVAGGTGAGIFYDYLHLIGSVFADNTLKAKIYPLVLMPSAFPEGMGGGRPAQLNSGRALLDVFRLVDQQNGGDAERDLHSNDTRGKVDPDDIAVHYPLEGRVKLAPSTVQTGFLFSRPLGAEPEDLHRAVVSLVLSLISTELDQGESGKGTDLHQSFADSFINASVDRQVPAENGIGNRGVSTALVASLTVPVDELADIVAGRLLRTAVQELSVPLGNTEVNRQHIEAFFTAAGIHPVFARRGEPFAEPPPVKGARNVAVALNDRADGMRWSLRELEERLNREVPQMVTKFEPRAALNELLTHLDVFHVRRVLFGSSYATSEVDRMGAWGLMRRRAEEPAAPEGMGDVPPLAPPMRDRFFGLVKVKWTESAPTYTRDYQNIWYGWRTHLVWSRPWAAQTPRWRRVMDQVDTGLTRLTDVLSEYARQDAERFAKRADDLYRPRVGVSFMLPAGGGDMEQFYRRVVRQMLERRVSEGQLQPNSTEADLLALLIGPHGWREAYRFGWEENDPQQGVSLLREQVKREVKTFLRSAEPGHGPLLPKLADLLSEAAGFGNGVLAEDELGQFRGKLAGLVPAGFTPQGGGPLKVLVSYPAGAPNPAIEGYLKGALNLPAGPGISYQFKPTEAESIAVVLFRTSMGVTEVREVREVLRLWADALANPEPQDYLRWRQRTGYDFGYLITREEHRVEVLHRLLCAMWNGRVGVEGDPASPRRIRVELRGGVTMTLGLTPMENASSWGSLLRAYELWTFADNADIRGQFCAQLMKELPRDLAGQPEPPDDLYLIVRGLATEQAARLDKILKDPETANRSRAEQYRGFWARTMESALDHRFAGIESPMRATLRSLETAVQRWNGDRSGER